MLVCGGLRLHKRLTCRLGKVSAHRVSFAVCRDLELRVGECETLKCGGFCELYGDKAKRFLCSSGFACRERAYELVETRLLGNPCENFDGWCCARIFQVVSHRKRRVAFTVGDVG